MKDFKIVRGGKQLAGSLFRRHFLGCEGVAIVHTFTVPHEVSKLDIIGVFKPFGQAFLIITHPTCSQ